MTPFLSGRAQHCTAQRTRIQWPLLIHLAGITQNTLPVWFTATANWSTHHLRGTSERSNFTQFPAQPKLSDRNKIIGQYLKCNWNFAGNTKADTKKTITTIVHSVLFVRLSWIRHNGHLRLDLLWDNESLPLVTGAVDEDRPFLKPVMTGHENASERHYPESCLNWRRNGAPWRVSLFLCYALSCFLKLRAWKWQMELFSAVRLVLFLQMGNGRNFTTRFLCW